LIGCLSALMTKLTHIKEHPLLETVLVALMSYCTFLASEAIGFTGIVAVLFCGIIQAHYTYNNLSEKSKSWTRDFFELLNFMAENFVFVYIGVSVFTFQQHLWNPTFIVCALFSCLIARAFHVYSLSALINLTPSRQGKERIPGNVQHMLVFCGLRGAMAFSLAIRNVATPSGRLFLTTTLVIVMVTVILSGGLTIPMLQCLKIKLNLGSRHVAGASHTRNQKQITTVEEEDNDDTSSLTDLTPTVRIKTDPKSKSFVGNLWRNWDRTFMKPFFTHSGPLLSETLPQCCIPCGTAFTTEEQILQSTLAQESVVNLRNSSGQ
jgi:solute carrier family 9 (sodium/hydrogen exchanger), member 6/7